MERLQNMFMVGTALFASGAATAVSAACSGATYAVDRSTAHVPPALRGRGHRSAMSLPPF